MWHMFARWPLASNQRPCRNLMISENGCRKVAYCFRECYMKATFLLTLIVVVTCLTDTAHSQIGQPEWGSPARQGLALLEDLHVSDVHQHLKAGSFTILSARTETILLDTATGDTWHLVFSDSEEGRVQWEPVTRVKGMTQEDVTPSDDEEFNPFEKGRKTRTGTF